MKARAIIIGLIVVALAAPCWAGRSQQYVLDANSANVSSTHKVALHMVAHGGSCKSLPVIADTNAINRTWSLTGDGADVDVFYVIYDYDSLLVFEFGLRWPAEWGTAGFTACTGPIQVGGIVNSGDGVALAFPSCQIAQRKGGSRPNFWTHCWAWLVPGSNGEVEIIPNPASGDLCLVDCRDLEFRRKHNPMTQYNAGVNVDPYEGPVREATRPATWGAIKAMFE